MTTPAAPPPSVLILLTNVFPFDKGEEFIENELPHLAEGFDRVVIAATKTRRSTNNQGPTLTRQIPPNAIALTTGRDLPRDRAGRLKQAALGLTSLRPGNLREAGANPRRLALDATYASLAGASSAALIDALKHHWVDWQLDRATITLYAYWLHTPALAAAQTAAWLRGRGATVAGVVARGHRYDIYPEVSSAHYLPQRRATLAGLDRVHVVSENGRQAVLATGEADADTVVVSHLGTKNPGPTITLNRAPFRLVSCAFAGAVKRLDRIPPIVQGLRERGIDARWTHIGSGDLLDSLREQSATLLGDDEAGEPICTFEGYVPNSELIETYRRLNPSVLVNLSKSEGLPVNLMEGASLGLPLVATNVGGVAELVSADNGHLLPADFTDQMAIEALAQLATMPADDFARLGARSRELWQAEFDEAVVYPAFVRDLHALTDPAH